MTNYTDFINAMHEARENGETVARLVLSEDSIDTWLTDGNFTDAAENKHDALGEFAVNVEQGDGDYILTESGNQFPL